MNSKTPYFIRRQLQSFPLKTLYRVTLMHNLPSGVMTAFNPGKDQGKDASGTKERFYSADEVASMAAWLARKNTEGFNVFVTPMPTSDHWFILIDDCDLPALIRDGFRSVLFQQSSSSSSQAVFLLSSRHAKPVANRLFRALNGKYGDPSISGLIHPFRLCGFTNRKPKYLGTGGPGLYPFVRLLQSTPEAGCCSHLDRLATQAAQDVALFSEERSGSGRAGFASPSSLEVDPTPLQPELAEFAARFYSRSREMYPQPDWSRIDYSFCCSCRKRGILQQQAVAAICTHSPSIQTRKSNPVKYAIHTAESAYRA